MSDYLAMCKLRVVALMLLTSVVGMLLAVPVVPWEMLWWGNLGIGLTAAAGAAFNHLVDRHFDAKMSRTKSRPIPTGKVTTRNAVIFATAIALAGLAIMLTFTNVLATVLTFVTLIGYALVYTVFLKHATPQNIVIGGLAGAMPPLLGWVAVTNHIDAQALLLVLIIFAWTPPHFWALSIFRLEDYRKADIPMLPVTHGIAYTKLNIVLYTVLLFAASQLPFAIGMSGWIYLSGASVLGVIFLYWSWRLKNTDDPKVAAKTFHYSIVYLMVLFVFLLVDHYV